MAKVLGLLDLHHSPNLEYLTSRRPLASTSFLGRYAFCDFTMSNFCNSGIDQVGILVKEKPRSLIKHLGSGKIFNANTKLGSVSIMYNERYANDIRYNTDINNIVENRWVIDNSNPDYIIIAPAHYVYRLDFSEVLEYHIKRKATVTMVYKKIENGKTQFINADTLRIESDAHVSQISSNKGAKDQINVSLETYIINRTKLEELVDFAQLTSQFFSLKDTLSYLCNQLYIDSYEYRGYLRVFNSIDAYMTYSLELLKPEVRANLFSIDWPIYTRTRDTPPAKYLDHSEVSNSIISNGAIIDGQVENSIIGRSVKIGKGAIVKNSIIFSQSEIGEGAYLENCIVDKSAKVIHIKELIGAVKHPLYINEKDIV